MKDKAENVGVGYDMKTQLESLHLICKAMGEMKNFMDAVTIGLPWWLRW